MKRAVDILVSGIAILILSPLLLPIMVSLRFSGEGYVFYRQERVGRGGKLFYIFKFSTMLRDSPNMPGGDITIGNDPRILPLGNILRKTKINELPQLLNVFIGDMSLVGWRPTTPRVAKLFPQSHWDALRGVRPGLSGVGSIVFRDEERLLVGVTDRQEFYASVIVPYKSALELWYAEHQTVWLDFKLIVLTVAAVLTGDIDLSRYLPGLPPLPTNIKAERLGVKG